jgi:ankyrin repeat protein
VQLLLAIDRVDPDSKDGLGCTPLSRAAENGHKVVVELLLAQKSVNPDSKDGTDRTPLSWAAENGHDAVVELLPAQKSVNPDSEDWFGRTPLAHATREKNVVVAKLLFARGAKGNIDLCLKYINGQTHLFPKLSSSNLDSTISKPTLHRSMSNYF